MKFLFACVLFFAVSLFAEGAPTGAPVDATPEEQKNLQALAGKLEGIIVWSTSRVHSSHDIWMMNADGTNAKALTSNENVDWFPRVSPDGALVLFNRSKAGFVPENDANYPEKWDLWTVTTDGKTETKIVENATWGTWRPDGKSIIFSRAGKVFSLELSSKKETLLLDGEISFKKKDVILQEPNMSPDGKHLAITLRGSMRETGIYDLEKNIWTKSGYGCQIDWNFDGTRIYRVNPTGNGGTAAPSEILWFTAKEGKPIEKVGFFGIPKNVKLMDLPGRRSHEYFPRLSPDGKWLLWGATDKGHDHDIYDYELYLWKIGEPIETATRLTYHTGNDRWPDIWFGKLPVKEEKQEVAAPVEQKTESVNSKELVSAISSLTTAVNELAQSQKNEISVEAEFIDLNNDNTKELQIKVNGKIFIFEQNADGKLQLKAN